MIVSGPSCRWIISSFNRYEHLYTVLAEGMVFKTFLKENYVIVWESCDYQNVLNMELDMV